MKKLILNNLRLKLVAIVFSVGLWFFVGGQRGAQVGFLMGLDLAEIPQDMVVVGEAPKQVEVRLSGPQGFINNLSPSQVSVEMDFTGAREGLNTYRIETHDVVVPRGIKVVSVSPRAFDIRLQRLMTVMLPVRVNFAGTPAMGYKVISLKSDPTEVEVFGTKKAVSRVKRVFTKLVDIEGIDSTKSLVVPVSFPEGVRGGIPENVYVTVTVDKKD
jgi:YbbR domain-containing protein